MNIWAISDLHLCFGTPEKSMETFGDPWRNYTEKIKEKWLAKIKKTDLVLICGDISWASNLDNAKRDFDWIGSLPGTKVIVKGNHDYWWSSITKVRQALPSSMHAIHHDSFDINSISICGARMWDCPDFNFDGYIDYIENPKKNKSVVLTKEQSIKIYQREIERLKVSLDALNKHAKIKIVMTHYPPISADLDENELTKLFKDYDVNIVIFGHLHNVRKDTLPFGTKDDIRYVFSSCDYLDFSPVKIF
jgi:uncharacterized protein